MHLLGSQQEISIRRPNQDLKRKPIMKQKKMGWTVALCLICLIPEPVSSKTAASILAETQTRNGLVIQVGTGDGSMTTGLTDGKNILVHGISLSWSKVHAAREKISEKGLDGVITVEKMDSFKRLPYKQNMGKLVVADLDALGGSAPSLEELKRVTSPYGHLYYKQNGNWNKEYMPVPSGMAEWTHHSQGPEGNNYSPDQLVKPSFQLKWINGYRNVATGGFLRIAGGRVINPYRYRADKEAGVPGSTLFAIEARDAFSGILLWRKNMGPNMINKIHRMHIIAATSEKVFLSHSLGNRKEDGDQCPPGSHRR